MDNHHYAKEAQHLFIKRDDPDFNVQSFFDEGDCTDLKLNINAHEKCTWKNLVKQSEIQTN